MLSLINSVLDNITTYIMFLFPMSSKVQKQLNKVRRSFLWKGNSEGHKLHLLKWSKVSQKL
uniref:Putative ovule protein n=1 Tax=Solanum chacoense TaxID=4108 RepID=A0A0V0GR58_SOLCH